MNRETIKRRIDPEWLALFVGIFLGFFLGFMAAHRWQSESQEVISLEQVKAQWTTNSTNYNKPIVGEARP